MSVLFPLKANIILSLLADEKQKKNVFFSSPSLALLLFDIDFYLADRLETCRRHVKIKRVFVFSCCF